MVRQIAGRLAKLGFGDRIALSLSAQNEMLAETIACGTPIHTVQTFSDRPTFGAALQVPGWRAALRDHLRLTAPDTVVIPFLFAAAAPLADVVRRNVKRLVYVLHDAKPHLGDEGAVLQQLAQRAFLALADEIVACSQATADVLVRARPQLINRVTVEPLASLHATERAARKAVRGRPFRFLVPGRLVAYKGFERLANAIALMPAESNFEVTISGDGPYRRDVEALLKGNPRVRLQFGWTPPATRRTLFDTHDILLCSHDDASQSGSLCEAFSVGMPSIVTPVGALPEQIGFGRAGLAAADMSAEAFAAAMRLMMSDEQSFVRWSAGAIDLLREAAATSRWPQILNLAPASSRAREEE
jgi:glycosyltransferase involved in cell wall biosynthesis